MQFAFFPAFFGRIGIHHFICPVVPDDDFAGSVVPLWDDAFKLAVVDRMIFGQHRQAFFVRIETGSFGNCPRAQHPFHFQAKIVMKASGMVLLNDETLAGTLFYFAWRFGSFIEPALPFIFFETHQTYNSGMGRMRIKKKEAVIPFRETMAYRMILAGGSLAVFISALYLLVVAFSTSTTLAISAGAVGVAAAFGVFYNLDQLRYAKVPKRTMNRMKRR